MLLGSLSNRVSVCCLIFVELLHTVWFACLRVGVLSGCIRAWYAFGCLTFLFAV